MPKINFFTMFRGGFKEYDIRKKVMKHSIYKTYYYDFNSAPILFPNFLSLKFDDSLGKSDYINEELIKKIDS